jgi:hypothetical protein
MPDSGINLSTTFGALAVGSVLCTVFWSFLLVQTYATSPWSMMRHSVLTPTCRVYYHAQSVSLLDTVSLQVASSDHES